MQACFLCNMKIKIEPLEFQSIYCEKCKDYIFILCVFCGQKIFFNKNKDNLPLNGMNGLNIKCPYTSCNKYFYLTICPKCKKYQKIPKILKEGEIIKCDKKKECGFEYLQVRCPIEDCKDLTYFPKPKNFLSNPDGFIYNHQKKLIFQKISCNFCFAPIVYISGINIINRYYDSMKIVCPYKNCKKCFNRIVCPICSEINIIEKGNYFMGHKVKCSRCKNFFGKIICPKCLKINPLTKNFFKSGEMICRYTECGKKSNIVNCLYCQRMNVFNGNSPIPGQQIICAYCNKIFNEVYCPSCNELNPFPKADFSFGTSYKCVYSFCGKFFQYLICPNCLTYSKITEKQEGKKYTCNKCNTFLSNWKCYYCKKTIMDKNSSLKYGQMIRCPNKLCNKEYSFCRCYECQKLIFNEKELILGKSVSCKSCDKFSVNIVCPSCNTKISFLDRMNDIEDGEKIRCSKCQNEFIFNQERAEMIDEKDIYSQNLSVLENIKGETINFGKSQVDENYLSIQKLLINTKLYDNGEKNKNDNSEEIQTKKKNNLCILCHCNLKESIFYPCGHRCACYTCIVYYFNFFKKCPKCEPSKTAISFVQKVYELFNQTEKMEIEKDEKEKNENK